MKWSARILVLLPTLWTVACDGPEDLDEDELALEDEEDELEDEDEEDEDEEQDTEEPPVGADELTDPPRPTHDPQPTDELPLAAPGIVVVEPVPPPDDLAVDDARQDVDTPTGPNTLRPVPPHGDPPPPLDVFAVEPEN
jgi:hypothetical protein